MNKQQLIEQIKKKRSFLCVGLDPVLAKLPKHLLKYENPVLEFNKQLIDATTKVSPNLHMGDEGVDLGALEQFSPCHVTTSQPSPALVATSRAVFPYWGLRPYG